MRKNLSLVFAICGTLLILLLFAIGRFVYVNVSHQSFSDIAQTGPETTLILTENDAEVQLISDSQQAAIIKLLSEQTYVPYPRLIKPSQNKLTANRLTVTFENGHSIGVNTDGYIFINGKLRAIRGGRGQELYHKLFVLFYPNAA